MSNALAAVEVVKIIEELAAKVFASLGSGYTESVYQNALAYELAHETRLKIGDWRDVRTEYPLVITYGGYDDDDVPVGECYVDILLWSLKRTLVIPIEVKCVKVPNEDHEAQLRKYMRLLQKKFPCELGVLVNFYRSATISTFIHHQPSNT